ncbi:MAG: hypothetical protein Q7W51_02605 [Coriobacteriia bacterium]|nr:hypothetical protein [Coriobacteriia bacterium]
MASRKSPPETARPAQALKRPKLPASERFVDEHIAWRFEYFHRQGSFFGWDALIAKGGFEQLMLHLRDFEGMNVERLFHHYTRKPGKYYEPPDIVPNPDAKRVLAEQYDDQDRLYLLRLWGSCRLFGFVSGNVFNVLWWDPDHLIWPTDPD